MAARASRTSDRTNPRELSHGSRNSIKTIYSPLLFLVVVLLLLLLLLLQETDQLTLDID